MVKALGTAGALLGRTQDMIDPALRDAVTDSHCDLAPLMTVCIVEVRLTDPFSPSDLSVLHMVVFEFVDLEDLEHLIVVVVVVGEMNQEGRCDIHAKDQSLVCEGLDGRTANVLKFDDDQLDMVQAVERMEFEEDPDGVGTAAATATAH